MRKRMLEYIALVVKYLSESGTPESDVRMLEDMLRQIAFFQHERLIHLLVTLLFGLLFVLTMLYAAAFPSFAMFGLSLVILVLLVPYLRHYYLLENGTQRLYALYDRLWKRMGK